MSSRADLAAPAAPAEIEVRIALVMTGGVSLAVWIGGVAAELYRAHKKHGLYRLLLDELRSEVNIDVISGASAGGLNGVLLAAALSRDLTVDEFDQLRDVWLRTGSIKELLRSPKEKNPPSLMQGDAYFQVQIENVLRGWLRSAKSVLDPTDSPLDVIMTATAISPQVVQRTDDLGQTISEPVHRARFHFTADDLALPADLLAGQLALAARTSASFPGAFEASFISIGESEGEIDMTGLANLDQSTWAMDGGVLMNKPVAPALDVLRSRTSPRHGRRMLLYVNPDPGRGAVAVTARRDAPPTMLSVISNALLTLPSVETIAADINDIKAVNAQLAVQRDSRFDLLQQVDDAALVDLGVRMYSLWRRRRDFDAIDQRLRTHFETVGGDLLTVVDGATYLWQSVADCLRATRSATSWLTETFPEVSDLAPVGEWRYGYQPLEYFASIALDVFRRAIDLLPVTAFDASSTPTDAGDGPEADGPPGQADAPDAPTVRSMLQGKRADVQHLRGALQLLRAADTDFWQSNLRRGPLNTSPAGVDERRDPAAFAGRLYRRWPAPPDDVHGDAPKGGYRLRAYERRRSMWAKLLLLVDLGLDGTWNVEFDIDHPLDDPQRRAVEWLSDPAARSDDAVAILRQQLRQRELEIARRFAEALIDGGAEVEAAVRIAAPPVAAPATKSAVGAAADTTTRTPATAEAGHVQLLIGRLIEQPRSAVGGDPTAIILRKLFALYIVHSMSEPVDETEVRLEFVQVSANAQCPLDPSRIAPSDKVAGLQLAHFGAFFKESWRANDWMWGRLDGVACVVAALVDPNRIRQQFGSPDNALQVFERLARAVGLDPALSTADQAELDARWSRARPVVDAEVRRLFGPDPVLRADGLAETHRVLIAAFQLLVVRTELVVVADSVRNSAFAGADCSAAARVFMSDVASARVADAAALPLASSRRLLSECQVGRETLGDEVGSDALTDDVTTAATVVAAAAAGNRGGLSAFRHVLATVRNVMLAVYMLAQNATRRSKTAFALTQLLLAFGAGAIAIKVSGGHVSTAVTLVAILVLVVWAAITALTIGAGWGLTPLLLMIIVIGWSSLDSGDARGAFGVQRPGDDWRDAVPITGLVIVALACLASMLLFIVRHRILRRALRDTTAMRGTAELWERMNASVAVANASPGAADLVDEAASIFAVFVDRIRAVRRPIRSAARGIVWSVALGVVGGALTYLGLRELLDRGGHRWLVTSTIWLNDRQGWVVLLGLPLLFAVLSLVVNRFREVRSILSWGSRSTKPPPRAGGLRRSFTDGSASRSVAWYRECTGRQVPASGDPLATFAKTYGVSSG